MKTPNDGTLWERAVKSLLSWWWQEQGPPNVDANTARLWHIPENEPTFRCIMDHAVVKLGNHLQEAMTYPPGAARDVALNKAQAMREFVDEIEGKREIWREHVKRQQQEGK